MLRSMYSGIAGMKNFQTKLDVIGNNIANVNTYGFKKGRTVFKDLVSQQIAGASAPTNNQGGTNPKQIGLGSQIAAIDTLHTQGSLQTTARTLDLALSGDGFFIVGSGNKDASTKVLSNLDMNYTRAGNFYLDKDGFIVNQDGLYAVGLTSEATGTPAVDPEPTNVNLNMDANGIIGGSGAISGLQADFGAIQIPTDAKSFSIGGDGSVTYVDNSGVLRVAGFVGIAKFPNNGGLQKVGENLFKNTPNSGDVERDGAAGLTYQDLNLPGIGGAGSLVAGALEMSNVDLSEEFTEMIVAQRGFQANTRIITTSDEILQELVNLKR